MGSELAVPNPWSPCTAPQVGMARHDVYPRVEIADATEWRSEHHDQVDGAWLVSSEKATGRPP